MKKEKEKTSYTCFEYFFPKQAFGQAETTIKLVSQCNEDTACVLPLTSIQPSALRPLPRGIFFAPAAKCTHEILQLRRD